MNALSESVLNPVAPATGAGYSSADRPSSVERKFGIRGTYVDVPEAQLAEVTPPKSRKASFVNLHGAWVLESASTTIHIQPAVLIPGEHKWLRVAPHTKPK
jgi:hypothetical protein